jgi:hypothetical protein
MKQSSYQEKGGVNLKQATKSAVKLSELKTNNQNKKTNSSFASASNLVNTKIPYGSSIIQNRSAGIREVVKTNSNVSFKDVKAPANSTRPNVMPSSKSIFKQIRQTKVADSKPVNNRPTVKDFKTIIPRERQREV